MICPHCGQDNPKPATLCEKCGTAFSFYAGLNNPLKGIPAFLANTSNRSKFYSFFILGMFALLFLALLYFGYRFLTQ